MKWGKTTTDIQQQRQSTVTSWQWKPNIFEEKTFARKKRPLWIKLDIKIKFWHTSRLFWLNPWVRGEHLTLTLVTRVSPVYLVDKLVLVFYTPLWLLKHGHQCLLKLHIHLGRFQSGEKLNDLQKRNSVWNRKITCEEVFQDLSKSCVSFGTGLESSNEKRNEEPTEGTA